MKKLLILFLPAAFIIACNGNDEKAHTPADVKSFSSPAGDSSSLPYLFTDESGVTHLSWVEHKGANAVLKFSSLANDQWSDPVTIASGGNWFVNWADYPSICADGKGNAIAHYLEQSDSGKFAYDVKYVVSPDKGRTWGAPRILNDDGKLAEHGFVSIMPYKDDFFVAWLDGRNTAMEAEHAGHDGHQGQMTLRGAILDKKGNKIDEWELDDKVCDCCQTSVAVINNGPVVVYRDRSDVEIRDMSIVRYVNHNWTAPKVIYPDNWKIAGCPVNGPRVDALGNNLAIAWFSMADKKGEVKLIFSGDGGATFSKPVVVGEGNAIGRVDVVMVDKNTAMVSWMEGSAVKAVKIKSDGTRESSIMIASSSKSRSSGFPQMTKSGNKLIFAWTDDNMKIIRIASLSTKED